MLQKEEFPLYTEINWQGIRDQFPAVSKYTYLNAAEGSAIPYKVAKAGKKVYEQLLEDGDLFWEEWLEEKEQVREKLANFINAKTDEIAFTHNTSSGMNIIAEMFKDKDFEVLAMEHEFPSSTIPWFHRNFTVNFVPAINNEFSIQEIKKHINPKTKIIVTSYVQYCTGYKQDIIELGKLCKEKGLIFIVNAAQAMGVQKVDVRKANIDFLLFTGHKWMLSSYGVGGLFINEELIDDSSQKISKKMKLPNAGWQSTIDPDLMDNQTFDIKNNSSSLELGCQHFPNIFSLGAALDFFNSIGIENIEKRISELRTYLWQELRKINLAIISPEGNQS